MKISRRRFLSITATFPATFAVAAETHRWHGRAFGSEVSLRIRGPERAANEAISEARLLIRQAEKLFSLYDPESALVQLNQNGVLRPSAHFLRLMRSADLAYRLSDGLFDPSVQPLWDNAVQGRDPAEVSHLVGWEKVRFNAARVALAPGQALTFNGIAQGFATDLVSERLQVLGFTQSLVNIGEYRGTGGPWTLGLSNPSHGMVDTHTFKDSAVATSSPLATPIGDHGHIFLPTGQASDDRRPWSTVSVEAETATLADALSTGLVWADMRLVEKVRQFPAVRRVTLVDEYGDLLNL
ncbi:FAD:protein FMN transferase [Granulosicoccus sp. 3-233]|uniref:FAD:protein FMN transferase n=1 Tax=Granulosicoccus sp. 3-233 TaxID=3417969 RepID=UPI003D3555D0